jgi:hypothetical protein
MEEAEELYDDSMAAAIEKAFELVWENRMGDKLPEQTRNDRRMMFVAIAQGVIKHLQDNSAEGFDVDVVDGEGTVTIKTTGDLYS